MRLKEHIIAFLTGAICYPILEIVWRGYSHWTMALTAGVAVTLIHCTFTYTKGADLWQKCVNGALIITLLELFVGYIVNLKLGWNIWDYSDKRLSFLGQICASNSAIWIILSFVTVYVSGYIEKRWRVTDKGY